MQDLSTFKIYSENVLSFSLFSKGATLSTVAWYTSPWELMRKINTYCYDSKHFMIKKEPI